MKRKALIVGINYTGSAYPLKGCVNDANLIADTLTNNFGFTDAKNRRMLTDESATTAAMLERLEWLVADAEPGDILWFSYSGHGSQMVNQKYDDADYEPDGKDEVICPIDYNWRDKIIRDDDLKRIFDKVPNGVNLTVLLDCCNSGSGLDQDNQYQPLGLGEARQVVAPPEEQAVKGARFIQAPADIENRGRGLDLEVKPRSVQSRQVNQTGLLVSGCQSQQTSADAWIGGKFMGAATYYMVDALKNANYDISYKDLIDTMNDSMVTNGYSQRPELDGSADLFQAKFLEPLRVGTGLDEPVTAPTVVPPIVEQTQPAEVVKPDKKKWIKIGLAVVAAAVAIYLVAASL